MIKGVAEPGPGCELEPEHPDIASMRTATNPSAFLTARFESKKAFIIVAEFDPPPVYAEASVPVTCSEGRVKIFAVPMPN